MSKTSKAVKPQLVQHGVREVQGLRIARGTPLPYGASPVSGGINFSTFSANADACTLVLFRTGEAEPFAEIPFPEDYRIGQVYSLKLLDFSPGEIEYGYRFHGPSIPEAGHRFDPSKVLLDPYAKGVAGRNVWRESPDWQRQAQYRGLVYSDTFDWGDVRNPELPIEDVVIYEAHVRGFTASPTAKVKNPGTYAGLREKLPYLKDLGITAIELLPIFEFDEHDGAHKSPESGEYLLNYWGYNTVNYFSPKAGYAAAGPANGQANELKELVKACHELGIEVYLDVVFNHTAEGDHRGSTFSFRGIDNRVFYMLTPDGWYYNFSGCGNTLNANHPTVRLMILDCLRHWVSEYHIDGFRFDLASILDRDENGAPLATPPLLALLTHAPLLGKVKLIAEAWDAGGLYQVGHFPSFGRFGEWNGKFRDNVRKFLKGEASQVGELAYRITGSPDLYESAESHVGVNFVTCHDGFTLYDLVSYDGKHNEANGEGNRDGADDNNSWNCGAEGETDDPVVNELRMRQMKNAFTLLLVSAGIPMISMGDEIARTQNGNNNAYCHDTPLSWMDWSRLDQFADLHRFVRGMIALRRNVKTLERAIPSHTVQYQTTFHGVSPWQADYSAESRYLGVMIDPTRTGDDDSETVYIAANSYWDSLWVTLPEPPPGRSWRVAANTGVAAPDDIFDHGHEPVLENQSGLLVGPRSTIVLLARRSS